MNKQDIEFHLQIAQQNALHADFVSALSKTTINADGSAEYSLITTAESILGKVNPRSFVISQLQDMALSPAKNAYIDLHKTLTKENQAYAQAERKAIAKYQEMLDRINSNRDPGLTEEQINRIKDEAHTRQVLTNISTYKNIKDIYSETIAFLDGVIHLAETTEFNLHNSEWFTNEASLNINDVADYLKFDLKQNIDFAMENLKAAVDHKWSDANQITEALGNFKLDFDNAITGFLGLWESLKARETSMEYDDVKMLMENWKEWRVDIDAQLTLLEMSGLAAEIGDKDALADLLQDVYTTPRIVEGQLNDLSRFEPFLSFANEYLDNATDIAEEDKTRLRADVDAIAQQIQEKKGRLALVQDLTTDEAKDETIAISQALDTLTKKYFELLSDPSISNSAVDNLLDPILRDLRDGASITPDMTQAEQNQVIDQLKADGVDRDLIRHMILRRLAARDLTDNELAAIEQRIFDGSSATQTEPVAEEPPSNELIFYPEYDPSDWLLEPVDVLTPMPEMPVVEVERLTVPSSPIVLDLDYDGIETLSLDDGPNFDLDGNEFKEKTAWVAPDDGLLAMDLNADGIINNALELFGNATLLPNGWLASNGFEALRQYDTNGNSLIDAGDAEFSNFIIWQDKNTDGVSQENELGPFEDYNIQAIRLDYTHSDYKDNNSVEYREQSSYITGSGAEYAAVDLWFPTDKANSTPPVNSENDAIDYSAGILELIDVAGQGIVLSLREAMHNDQTGELQALVESYYDSWLSPSEQAEIADQIMHKWSGVSPDYDSVFFRRDLSVTRSQLDIIARFWGAETIDEIYPNVDNGVRIISWRMSLDEIPHNIDMLSTVYSRLKAKLELSLLRENDTFAMLWDRIKFDFSSTYTADYESTFELLDDTLSLLDPSKALEVVQQFKNMLKNISLIYHSDFSSQFFEQAKNTIANQLNFTDTAHQLKQALLSEMYVEREGAFYSLEGGPETIMLADDIDIFIKGTSMDDTYLAPDVGTVIFGEAGNDTLQGGAGDDYLDGGAGSDTFIVAADGSHDVVNDVVERHRLAGTDKILFEEGIRQENISFSRTAKDLIIEININETLTTVRIANAFYLQIPPISYFEFSDSSRLLLADIVGSGLPWVGTDGDERVEGTLHGEDFDGGAGDDEIYGLGGNDTIRAGSGTDRIYGGDGNDVLIGDRFDTVFGGNGDDLLRGGHMLGGAGNDVYQFGIGDGWARIHNDDEGVGRHDVLRFLEGINPEDISITQSFSGSVTMLKLTVLSTGDYIEIANLYGDSRYHINEVQFHNGENWDFSYLVQQSLGGTENGDNITGTSVGELLSGMGGDDYIFGLEGDDILYGDEGNDRLYGHEGNDTLDGGEGRDRLYGGDGDDVLRRGSMYGEAGNDTYRYQLGDGGVLINNNDADSNSHDKIQLLEGILPEDVVLRRNYDELRIYFTNPADTISVSGFFADGAKEIDSIEFSNGMVWGVDDIKLMVLNGTENNDYLASYEEGGSLQGLGGDDRLVGNIGIDSLSGGEGRDDIYAGLGDDVLYGDGGDDHLYGEVGNDELFGGEGDDRLWGGEGDDILQGGPGSLNYLRGEEGNDSYLVGNDDGDNRIINFAADSLVSTDIIRFIDGISPNEISVGNQNNDLLLTRSSNGSVTTIENFLLGAEHEVSAVEFSDGTIWDTETLKSMLFGGTENADSITGSDQDDVIYGLGGDDILSGNLGDDFLDGGSGDDALWGIEGDDTLTGGSGDDLLYGNGGNDVLSGGSGNDYLSGGDGNDILRGDEGNDILAGQNGSDTYHYSSGDGNTVLYQGDTSLGRYDQLVFDPGLSPEDITVTRSGDDLVLLVNNTGDEIEVTHFFVSSAWEIDGVVFSDGTVWDADTLRDLIDVPGNATGDPNTIDGTTSDDTLNGTSDNDLINGFEGNDRVYGLVGDDSIFGGDGDDHVSGMEGNDFLSGGAGRDYVYGGDGNDTLSGGSGNFDELSGGAGDDIYLFSLGDGPTNIDNYDISQARFDKLKFAAGILPSDISLEISGTNLSLLLTVIPTGETIRISKHFSESDFAIDAIEFENGVIWDRQDIQDLVDGTTNSAPIAVDDIATTAQNNSVIINVLANDTDPENDLLFVSSANAFFGTVSINPVGTLNYAPTLDFHGTDTISYEVSDGNGGMATASVSVTVNPENDDPVAVADTAATSEDTQVVIDVLENDSDVDGDALIVQQASALYGSVSINPDMTLLYTPNSGFIGIDTLSYQISDGHGGTASASVNVQVDSASLDEPVTLIGSNVVDVFTGGNNNDTLDGRNNNDTLYGLAGNDVLIGGYGDDTIYGGDGDDDVDGGGQNDTIYGGAGIDIINGGNGDDTIYGGDQNDTIDGGTGVNFIDGGDGNDTLKTSFWSRDITTFKGGRGNDNITGSTYTDIYHFASGDGQDTILDNGSYGGSSVDQLIFSSDISKDSIWFSQQGDDLLIEMLGTLDNVLVTDWFKTTKNQLERVETGNDFISNGDLNQLVSFMAGFGSPANGSISLTSSEQEQVSNAIAAAWQ